jgi:hypothetical protein
METMKNVPILISLPRKFRDLLRRMAAERNLSNPNQVTSAARIGSKIIVDYLRGLESKDGGSTDGKQSHTIL